MSEKKPWTQAKFESFIKGLLRKGTTRWPQKYEVLNAAKRGKMVNDKTGRLAEHYQCASCGKLFPASDVVVDHISPVVPVTGFVSWDDIIVRMFCNADGLQVLCKDPCHKLKTKEENAARKLHKNNNNEKE